MTFSSKTPRAEQLVRAAKRKQVGRKHNHTAGPGRKAAKKREAQRNLAAKKRAIARRYSAAACAYWRGETEQHP